MDLQVPQDACRDWANDSFRIRLDVYLASIRCLSRMLLGCESECKLGRCKGSFIAPPLGNNLLGGRE